MAVFDTRSVALQTIAELHEAELDDFRLAVVRGETIDGATTVAGEDGAEILLSAALGLRGSNAEIAVRFDGICRREPR